MGPLAFLSRTASCDGSTSPALLKTRAVAVRSSNGNVEDYIKLVKAAQMSPQIHCIDSGIVETMDLPLETRHLDMDYLVMRYTDKPLMTGGATYETTRGGVEMAAILFGGAKAIEASTGGD